MANTKCMFSTLNSDNWLESGQRLNYNKAALTAQTLVCIKVFSDHSSCSKL